MGLQRGQGSITTKMNAVSLLVVLFAVAASAEEEVARKPKLFFVSTSATTTTLQTLSICFVSSNSITTCTGRKRRAINMDGGLSLEDAASVEVEPSQREQDASAPAIDGSRDGRFLLSGSPPPPPQPPSPPPTPSAVPSAPLPEPTFVDKPKTTKLYLLCSIFWIILPNVCYLVCKEYK